MALVFGNEHRGVSDEALALADARYAIPMRGFSQSLNVSVAAAVSLPRAVERREAERGRHGDLARGRGGGAARAVLRPGREAAGSRIAKAEAAQERRSRHAQHAGRVGRMGRLGR